MWSLAAFLQKCTVPCRGAGSLPFPKVMRAEDEVHEFFEIDTGVCSVCRVPRPASARAPRPPRSRPEAAVRVRSSRPSIPPRTATPSSLPAGSCTWTSTVTIDGKSITLQGAGIDATAITDGIDSGGGAKPVMLQWITKNTGLSRLTGFTFNGGSTGGKSWTTIVAFYGSTASLRIDHNKIIPTRVKGMEVSVSPRRHRSQLLAAGSRLVLPGSRDSSPELGRRRRLRRQLLGAADELRQFAIHVRGRQPVVSSGGHVYATDGWMGQRVVYRRNTFTNSTWANHGTETSGRWRSARASEVYQNTFVVNTDGGSDWSLRRIPERGGIAGRHQHRVRQQHAA